MTRFTFRVRIELSARMSPGRHEWDAAAGSTPRARNVNGLPRLTIVLAWMVLVAGVAPAVEISTNGTGGGPWSDPATWRGNKTPAADDDVVIRKFDTVSVDKSAACQKLLIDPRGILQFKRNSGKVTLEVAAGVENFGTIKIDATRSAQDDFEIFLSGADASKRKVQIARGAGLLLYGHPNLPAERRNAVIRSTISDTKDGKVDPKETTLIQADGPAGIDWQWARLDGVKLLAQKIDNTGAKPNERIQVLDCRFENNARLQCHTCDTPVIARNRFDARPGDDIPEPALHTLYSPLSEIKGNRVRGKFSVGVAFAYQSDTTVADNAVEGCVIGVHGYAVPAAMMRDLAIKNCETGLRIDGGDTAIEDVAIDAAKSGLMMIGSKSQLTNVTLKNLDPKGVGLDVTALPVSLLNCTLTPEQIKIAPGAKAGVLCQQYLVVEAADAPAGSLIAVRSIDPARPKGAADPNVRNSPSPVMMGRTPSPQSLTPLIVRSWSLDEKGAKVAPPEYTLDVLGAAKEGETRPVLRTITFRPMEASYRAADDETPNLKVPPK